MTKQRRLTKAVTVLLELQRCRAILSELVLRIRGPLGPDDDQATESRLTIAEARRGVASSHAMAAALATHHGFATYIREFSLSHAMHKAQVAGQPLDPGHPLPVLQRGSTGWLSALAYCDPAMIVTTANALEGSIVVACSDRERQDLPRFFGMTAAEFVTASLQTILAAHRRGPNAVTKRDGAADIQIDQSLFKLACLMLAEVDVSGEGITRFDQRARHTTTGTGYARRGQAREDPENKDAPSLLASCPASSLNYIS